MARIDKRRAICVALLVLLCGAVLLVIRFFGPPQPGAPDIAPNYNHIGGLDEYIVAGPLGDAAVSAGFAWLSGAETVTTVSWTYGVEVSALIGIDHFNLTVWFGYKWELSALGITTLDSKSWTGLTSTGSYTDSGSEDVDTHTGRYISDPVADESYIFVYYVKYELRALGAKSGEIYIYNSSWVEVDSGTLTYQGSEGKPDFPGVSWIPVLAGFSAGILAAVIMLGRREK